MATTYDRAVRFEEVDAAGILFFARYLAYCHEAMERFFDGIPGGYVDLIVRRQIGFPAVHLSSDYEAPLRYGDTARIETSVLKVGETSTTFRYVLTRLATAERAEAVAAVVQHVCVAADLRTLTKVPLPADCRALLEAHRATPAPG